jgi:hypothetical protein
MIQTEFSSHYLIKWLSHLLSVADVPLDVLGLEGRVCKNLILAGRVYVFYGTRDKPFSPTFHTVPHKNSA